MASTKDMTETDLLHADQIFENTVGLIEDIIVDGVRDWNDFDG